MTSNKEKAEEATRDFLACISSSVPCLDKKDDPVHCTACQVNYRVAQALSSLEQLTVERVCGELIKVMDETNKTQSAVFPTWDKPTAHTLQSALRRRADELRKDGKEDV